MSHASMRRLIAGRIFEKLPAAIDPTESAPGTALLREFVMTLDYPQRRLWLEPII